MGDGHISSGSVTPPQGAGPQRSPIFGSSVLFMHTPFDAELPNLTY